MSLIYPNGFESEIARARKAARNAGVEPDETQIRILVEYDVGLAAHHEVTPYFESVEVAEAAIQELLR